MSNLINPDGAGKRRDRLVRSLVLALRELAGHKRVTQETRDLVAFLVMALHQVDGTIDETCLAWEKRDYWIKADQFRQQWAWTAPAAKKLEQAVLEDKWQLIPEVVPEVARHLSNVTLPKRNTIGEPWRGAHAALLQKRERLRAAERRG